MLNGRIGWDKATGFLERGGGRGGIARERFGSRTESIWIARLPPATGLLSSGAKGFSLSLIGSGRGKSGFEMEEGNIGGGGRLIELVDGFRREEVERGPKRGDALGEAGLEERVGGGGRGRSGDLRSDKEVDLR